MVTVAVAVAGYLRELLLAGLFGAGKETDAFYLSLAFVQTVHDLLFAGALTATVVPLLHGMRITDPETRYRRTRFVVTAASVVLVAGIGLATLLRLAMPGVVQVMSPDMPGAARDLALSFADILVWAIPANAVVTLFVLVLNAHNRFRLAAASYLINNLTFIVVAYTMTPVWGPYALPAAFLAGPLLNIPIMAYQVRHLGLFRIVPLDLSRDFFMSFWAHSRPILISLGIGSTIGLLMVSQLIARTFASGHGGGAISALGYAFRLYEVPISLIVNPAATMIFPAVAALHLAGDKRRVAEVTSSLLMWGLIVLFPAAMITAAGSEVIVQIVLQRGKFDLQAVQLTAEALRGFAPAIMLEAVFMVFFRIFYAMHRSGWTVSISAAGIATLVAVLFFTRQGSFIWVPLSVSIAFAVTAAFSILLVVRTFGRSALPDWNHVCRWLLAAGLGVVAWKITTLSLMPNRLGALLAVAAFSVVYLVALALLLADHRRLLFKAVHRAFVGAG
jgi:putative peptidoglycan lipid II flippase